MREKKKCPQVKESKILNLLLHQHSFIQVHIKCVYLCMSFMSGIKYIQNSLVAAKVDRLKKNSIANQPTTRLNCLLPNIIENQLSDYAD